MFPLEEQTDSKTVLYENQRGLELRLRAVTVGRKRPATINVSGSFSQQRGLKLSLLMCKWATSSYFELTAYISASQKWISGLAESF